jgi:hypothetical protein
MCVYVNAIITTPCAIVKPVAPEASEVIECKWRAGDICVKILKENHAMSGTVPGAVATERRTGRYRSRYRTDLKEHTR